SRSLRARQPRRTRRQPVEIAELFQRLFEQALAGLAQLVVAPRRPAFALRDRRILPARVNTAVGLELAERRIHRAAREAGHVDDVEAVPIAVRDGFEDREG